MSQSYFPIDKLAIELLCEIFMFCCEVETPDAPPLHKKIHDKIILIQRCSPLTLVHVSRSWRAAGIQLHPIWSFIKVSDGTPLSKIRFWLDRSGNHPLSIFFEDIHPNRILDAYNLLAIHASRWREFRIFRVDRLYDYDDVPRDRDWHLVPFLTRTNKHYPEPVLSVPMLSALHLQKHVDMIPMNYPSFSSSSLRNLTIAGVNFGWSHLGLNMALSTITDLEVDQTFYHIERNLQFLQSLSQMTALKYLRVNICFILSGVDEISLESVAHPMALPNLQELGLRIFSPSTIFWAWLTSLNAPKLWHLFLRHFNTAVSPLDNEEWQEQQDQAELARLRSRIRFPSLTHFHCELEPPFWSGASKNFDIIALMPAITTISNLTLFSWSGTRTFLAFLTFDCTFPHLKHVKFLVDLDDPKEEGRVLSEAIARLNPNVTLTFEDY
ncbi:hypothetical protein FRC03_002143 [Tulasnella sp. 419]|nr:hypothetical protein FRC03_002143 [Tulasnella sp. 419]